MGILEYDLIQMLIKQYWKSGYGDWGMILKGLWQSIIADKYRLENKEWSIPFLLHGASGFWKSILLVKLDFENCIRYHIHTGGKLIFGMIFGMVISH